MLGSDIKDLSKITFWTVDDRWLPKEDDNSNQKLINSFFSNSSAKVLEFEYSSSTSSKDANDYSNKLQENIKEFDTVILGIGEDGHIASLFPGTTAVDNDTDLYVSNEVNIITKWRVTATYKLLTQVSTVYFLVTGENKKEILTTILNDGKTPANKLINDRSETILITDQAI